VRTGSRELLLTLRRTATEIASRRAIVAVSARGTAVTIVVSADCEAMNGDDRVLTFEAVGRDRFIGDAVETIVCCDR